MKRNELVNKLVKEGFSEKTLIWFNDKQLITLHNTLFEQQPMKGAVIMKKQTTPPNEVKKLTDSGVNVELREKKNKKIESKEIYMRGGKKGNRDHYETKVDSKRKVISQKLGPEEKESKVISQKMDPKKKKEGDVDEAARTMANGYHGGLKKMKYKAGRKDITCKEGTPPKTVQEWVEKIVENKYHSLTTKNEIMELITTKLHENELEEGNPQTTPSPNTPAPTTIPAPGTKPAKPKRENPFEPKHNPRPKAKVKLPEFLKFKSIGIRLKNSK